MSRYNIDNVFKYHRPSGNQPERYEHIRNNAREFAHLIDSHCPDSAEKTIAFRKLEECVMYANASIARNENDIIPNI